MTPQDDPHAIRNIEPVSDADLPAVFRRRLKALVASGHLPPLGAMPETLSGGCRCVRCWCRWTVLATLWAAHDEGRSGCGGGMLPGVPGGPGGPGVDMDEADRIAERLIRGVRGNRADSERVSRSDAQLIILAASRWAVDTLSPAGRDD